MSEARSRHGRGAMDQRIRLLLTDVLALVGKEPGAAREGCAFAPTNCEPIFRAQEVSKRMRGKAAHANRARSAGCWWAHVVLAQHSLILQVALRVRCGHRRASGPACAMRPFGRQSLAALN
jgi:hypothetical protein